MAPATRSKTRGSASVSGLRDPAVDSPSSSSDLTTLAAAPNQRTTKKRKREVSKQFARPKKRGRLQALPDMPIDILIDIFSALDLRSLICISRTTKAFRNLVLSPDFGSCWKASFDIASDEDEVPPCPKDAQIIPWAMLVCGSMCCHICGNTCQRKISFSLRMRICVKCMKDGRNMKIIKDDYFRRYGFEDVDMCEILPAASDPDYYGDRTFYARYGQFDKIQQAVEDAWKVKMEGEGSRSDRYDVARAAVAACLQKFREDFHEQYQHALLCDEWQDRAEARQEAKRESIRRARKQDITSRLLSLGYTKGDMSASCIWQVKGVIIARPLKEDSWELFFQKFKDKIEHARSNRLRHESNERHKGRKYVACAAFLDFLTAGALPREEFERVTHPSEYAQLKPIADYLKTDVPMTDEWYRELRATFDAALIIVREDLEARRSKIVSLIPSLPPGAVEGTPLAPMQMLDLATSVFQEAWGSNSHRLYFGSTALQVCRYERGRASGNVLSSIGHEAITQLLSMLRLPLTATFQDLVDLDACFVCTSCPPPRFLRPLDHEELGERRNVCSWTDAIEHYIEHHNSGCTLASTLHLLTEDEIAWLREELIKYPSSSPPTNWVCNHCKVYV